jgi:dihydroorotate dehydrogenase
MRARGWPRAPDAPGPGASPLAPSPVAGTVYGALRSLLFRFDPERSHHLALGALARAQHSAALQAAIAPTPPSPRLATDALGLRFPAPLGVAAGLDKEAVAYNALLALGFGHVEVGTVTPRAQAGNEAPRVQRFPHHDALVNRLGFPGPGAATILDRLTRYPPRGIVAANIGPNKTTAAEAVPDDLRAVASILADHAAFLTVNVSSPNTPGLRALQTPEAVARLVAVTREAADQSGHPRPVLLKLHPDAPDDELVTVARAAIDAGAAGIVATNTTRARPTGFEGAMDGGLSGAPLRDRSRAAIAALHHGLGRDVPIIGVGGIQTAADALGHIQAGATLLQAYTGFIYQGPRMPSRVHQGLVKELDRLGLDRLEEAVGTAA